MEGQFRPPNTEADLAGLRAAGAVAAAVLDEACKAVAPGVTTEEIDAVAHAACRELRTISTLLPLQHLAYRTPTCGQSWLFNHRAVLTCAIPLLPRPSPPPPPCSSCVAAAAAAAAAAACSLHLAPCCLLPATTVADADAVPLPALVAVSYGAWPTGLGFRGFPKSCCTSVNEVVCHGIPDSRPLEDGDLVTIDCVAFLGMRCSVSWQLCCCSTTV